MDKIKQIIEILLKMERCDSINEYPIKGKYMYRVLLPGANYPEDLYIRLGENKLTLFFSDFYYEVEYTDLELAKIKVRLLEQEENYRNFIIDQTLLALNETKTEDKSFEDVRESLVSENNEQS